MVFHIIIVLHCRYPVSFIADYLTNHHDAAWHMTHNTLLAGTHAVIPALIKLQKRGQRILVIHGVEDTSCQISSSEEMSRRFSIVELHPVPGYGHVDVLWKREQEPCRLIEGEINAGDAKFAIADRTASWSVFPHVTEPMSLLCRRMLKAPLESTCLILE